MFFTIDQAKEQVAIMEALERLEANPDFKKVIIEGYCKSNSDVLVRLLSQTANERQYKERCDKLLGISYFRDFLHSIHMEGEHAKKELDNPELYDAVDEQQGE